MPPKKSKIKSNATIVVSKIDNDGDGIPDGDLVSITEGNKTRYIFVPKEKMETIAKNALARAEEQQLAKPIKKEPKQRVIYKSLPKAKAADAPNTSSPVQVQDRTTFGQYIKAGAGMQLGSIAVTSIFDGLSGLFSE
jgi:hypothetical protein